MRTVTLLACAAFVLSCDSVPVGLAPAPSSSSLLAVESVVVTPASVTFNAIGLVDTLEAVAYDATPAPIPGAPFTWRSTKPEVATVDSTGIIQAIGLGITRVIATSSGKADTSIVRVTQVTDSLVVTPLRDTIDAIDGTAQLNAQAWDSEGNVIVSPVVIWTALDPGLATVSNAGLVTGEGVGLARIKVKSGTKSMIARVLVRQVPVTLNVTPSNATIRTGFAQHFTASGTDANGHAITSGFTWTSSNTAVALAETSGDAAGVSPGTSTIKAKLNGVAANARLDVIAGRTRPAVSAAAEHTCGHESGGASSCWGRNNRGNLGDATAVPSSNVPVTVAGGFSFTSVTTGAWHACGLLGSGAVKCWGFNDFGQLGDSTQTNRNSPVDVKANPPAFTYLATGFRTNCGVTVTGAAYCWGLNNGGQIGDNTTTHRFYPVPVQGSVKWSMVVPGWFHSCGLDRFGTAYCWGRNTFGQLGTGGGNVSLPALVNTGLKFKQIATGYYHSCALTEAGAAYCWGRNDFGQIGDNAGGSGLNDTTIVALPVAVQGGHTFAYIDVDGEHSCGVTTTGAAYCWGRGGESQLGDGFAVDRHVPTLVSGGHTFATIDPGNVHTCATTTTGTAYCWGTNGFGQVGDASNTLRPTPVTVSGGLTFSKWLTGLTIR